MKTDILASEIINKAEQFVKAKHAQFDGSHDWWHIDRVRKMARTIADQEGSVDLFIIDLAALLHDIGDWKLQGSRQGENLNLVRHWLREQAADQLVIDHVVNIIESISYKGSGVPTPMKTKEGMIVQDADRLDAMGAIGIARCFAYSGKVGRPLYDPNAKANHHSSFAEYQQSQPTGINHFYEKLLLLKERLNTKSAKRIGEQRHRFMEEYLAEFFIEIEGKA